MENYKKALYEAIEESTGTARERLNDSAQDFIADAYIDSSYICDAISSFADNNTSIYYDDIKNFICNNIDAITDAIDEFGWDGCGSNLYKAGQMAEFMTIERDIYNELEDVIKYIALDFIDATEEADEDAERIWETLSDEKKDEIIDEFIASLEIMDNNSRLDEISDLFIDFTQNILNEDESEG